MSSHKYIQSRYVKILFIKVNNILNLTKINSVLLPGFNSKPERAPRLVQTSTWVEDLWVLMTREILKVKLMPKWIRMTQLKTYCRALWAALKAFRMHHDRGKINETYKERSSLIIPWNKPPSTMLIASSEKRPNENSQAKIKAKSRLDMPTRRKSQSLISSIWRKMFQLKSLNSSMTQ